MNSNDHTQGKGFFWLDYNLVEHVDNPAGISTGGYILYDMQNINRSLLKPVTPQIEMIDLLPIDPVGPITVITKPLLPII